MTSRKHLSKPPITEAIVDIRVRHIPSNNIKKIEEIGLSISKEYPTSKHIVKGSFKVSPGKKPPVISQEETYGFRYDSEDRKHVVQFKLDGFAFSRLGSYDSWRIFHLEAIRLWEIYKARLSPSFITRVSLRYINRINIPLPVTRLSEYFSTPPAIPSPLDFDLKSYFTRFVVSDLSLAANAIIIQMSEESTDPKVVPIILDIDVIKEQQFPIDGKEAWETIGKLRHLKNKIFFESITQKTEDMLS